MNSEKKSEMRINKHLYSYVGCAESNLLGDKQGRKESQLTLAPTESWHHIRRDGFLMWCEYQQCSECKK